MTTLDERFDQKFSGVQRGGFNYPVQYEIKSFIHSEVDLALKDYKERVVKILDGIAAKGLREREQHEADGFYSALQQVIYEINKLDI